VIIENLRGLPEDISWTFPFVSSDAHFTNADPPTQPVKQRDANEAMAG
jgi:hypothetical protein